MFSVQGPKAKDVLNEIVAGGVEDLKFFSHKDYELQGIPVIVNHGGYTGKKWGYEIYMTADQADEIEAVLRSACEKAGGRQVTEFQVIFIARLDRLISRSAKSNLIFHVFNFIVSPPRTSRFEKYMISIAFLHNLSSHFFSICENMYLLFVL